MKCVRLYLWSRRPQLTGRCSRTWGKTEPSPAGGNLSAWWTWSREDQRRLRLKPTGSRKGSNAVINRWEDMRAVMTPVATPRAKDPLKTPRKIPKDFSRAMASKLWLLSPVGWYATMELQWGEKRKGGNCLKKELNIWEEELQASKPNPTPVTAVPSSCLAASASAGRSFLTGYWSWVLLLGLACVKGVKQTCTLTELNTKRLRLSLTLSSNWTAPGSRPDSHLLRFIRIPYLNRSTPPHPVLYLELCTWELHRMNLMGGISHSTLQTIPFTHPPTHPPTHESTSGSLPGFPLPFQGLEFQERAKVDPLSCPAPPSGRGHCTRTYGWTTQMSGGGRAGKQQRLMLVWFWSGY